MNELRLNILIFIFGLIGLACKKDVQPDNLGRFMKFYGEGLIDHAYDLQQTSGGEFIISGYTENAEGVRKAYVIKTDQLGNLLWEKTYGDSSNFSEFKRVKLVEDGYLFCGTFEDSSASIKKEIYFVKTDVDGGLIWEHKYGGIEDQEGNDFAVMPSGEYVLAGSSTKQNQKAVGDASGLNQSGVKDCYLVLLDADDLSIKRSLQMGGAQDDQINSIVITDNGDRVFCASVLNYDINQGEKQLAGNNLSIIRIDADGDKFAQGPQLSFGSLKDDNLVKIIAESDSRLLISGNKNDNDEAIVNRIADRENMALSNLDETTYNGKINTIEGVENLIINDIKTYGGGNLIITGNSNGLALINMDAAGNIIWHRVDSDLSQVNTGNAVVATSEGGFAVVGNTGFGVDGDIMLLKVNSDGNL